MHVLSRMSPLPTLPPELITEILSWLPVMFLVRFKCVCKFWKSLISNSTFTKLHLQRSPKNTHLLLTLNNDLKIPKYNNVCVVTPYSVPRLLEHPSVIVNEDDCFCFNADAITPLSCINGLVCLVGFRSLELWVQFWNPTLRLRSQVSQTLTVTNFPRRVKMHLGYGYDDSSDTYKVVAVFWDPKARKREGRVHCMGNNCWRKTLACPDFPILLENSFEGHFVNGSVNWLALNLYCHRYQWENVTIKQLMIFSLDLRDETHKFMLLPDGFGEKPHAEPLLAALRGCVCLFYDHMRTHFVGWEMKEFGVQESWTRLVNVSYVHLGFQCYVPQCRLFPVCLSENGDILLLFDEIIPQVIKYNRRDYSVECVELPNNIGHVREYTQSLILPSPHPLPH